MSNFSAFKEMIIGYLSVNGISLSILSNLHETSLNKEASPPKYVYTSSKDLQVLDMDLIARKGYKIVKGAKGINNVINTTDAFIINKNNEWYFIEFKDSKISADNDKLKSNIIKKAYSNWYMLLDILFFMYQRGMGYSNFSIDNPIDFAKKNVCYILVCSEEKNPNMYQQIKNSTLVGEKYTPPFMERLKDYMFKEAYVYTESFLERKFVEGFEY